ncbi:hypothetical protein LZ30DRAFT_35582 [Colletotrichum cereale]|nr:hypothetical protein LZ30DRAFT_35582 [Colletotrichum cereale]
MLNMIQRPGHRPSSPRFRDPKPGEPVPGTSVRCKAAVWVPDETTWRIPGLSLDRIPREGREGVNAALRGRLEDHLMFPEPNGGDELLGRGRGSGGWCTFPSCRGRRMWQCNWDRQVPWQSKTKRNSYEEAKGVGRLLCGCRSRVVLPGFQSDRQAHLDSGTVANVKVHSCATLTVRGRRQGFRQSLRGAR